MRSFVFLTSAVVATGGYAQAIASDPVTGKLGNATVVTSNPARLVYEAVFPDTPFFKPAYPGGGNVKGRVAASASHDGIGIVFHATFSNLPREGGPFIYHIHVAPVPESGNCTETLAHHDPFIRGEDTSCDPNYPQTCQVGDLSGKHGKVPVGKSYEATYLDYFLSTQEGLGSYFGNRSIVFHYANKTRISCANFRRVEKPEGGIPTLPAVGTACVPNPVSMPTAATTTIPGNHTAPHPTGSHAHPSSTAPVIAGGAHVRAQAVGLSLVLAALAFTL